jgi:tetratricopeptide (TPR) repeat protein/tRNA A-37 threonylcarbamoyl transferase component Bud32
MNEPPEAAYKKGDVIGGRYEVHALLGRGGFGEVYLVLSRSPLAVSALKTFRQEFLADAAAKETFRREALLWVNLEEHPHILSARFVEEVSGRLFVAMDYIVPDERGRATLADYLRHSRGPLDTDQSLVWAIQFCHGMEHAAAHGIKCHRDIKPANILIRQDGTLLISDFGLAAAMEAGRRLQGLPVSLESIGSLKGDGWTGSAALQGVGLSVLQSVGKEICGTPGYIAPELLDGAGADVRSDIYSFGLVLWQMATGSQLPPFAVGLTLPENQHDVGLYAFAIHSKQKSERAPAVPGPWQEVIARCLAPNPANRFASFAELRSELEPVLKRRSGKTVQLPPREGLSIAFWNNRGISLQNLGRVEEAVSCFQKALEFDPLSIPSQYCLARAFHAKRDFSRSHALFRKILRAQPDYLNAHIGLGVLLHDMGDSDGAVAALREAVRLRPESAEAHSHLGRILQTQGDLEGAVAAYQTAVRLQPDDASAHHNLGVALGVKGDRAGAIAAYRATVRIRPDDAVAHVNLGVALSENGDVEGAIAAYRAAIYHQPDLLQAYINLAWVLFNRDDYDGAIAACRGAIRLQPDLLKAHATLAFSLKLKGDLDGAIAAWRDVIRLQPHGSLGPHNLGKALFAKGDRYGAIAAYRTAIRLQPDNAEALNDLGISLGREGDLEGAIAAHREGVRVRPDFIYNHTNLGCLLLGKKDGTGAEAAFRAALRLQPSDAETYARLALALLMKGDRQAGCAALCEGYRLAPNNAAVRGLWEGMKPEFEK